MKIKLTLLIFLLFNLLFALDIKYIDRKDKQIKQEIVAGKSWLEWLYYNKFGEFTLNTLVKRKVVSDFYGFLMDKEYSIKYIPEFIEDLQIDMNDYKDTLYTCFNDFFVRELKDNARKINFDEGVLISPADGKVSVFQNLSENDFWVKGKRFSLKEFLQNDSLANIYQEGTLLIVRLCPADYHRYHFPIDGNIIFEKKIKGNYFSVSPIAIKKIVEIFCLNKREYSVIENKQFGNVLMAEIGATMVGSIVQTYEDKNVKKGQEKGYFKFGGSSIILIFEKNKIKIDADLLENSQNGMETKILMGERLGKSEK